MGLTYQVITPCSCLGFPEPEEERIISIWGANWDFSRPWFRQREVNERQGIRDSIRYRCQVSKLRERKGREGLTRRVGRCCNYPKDSKKSNYQDMHIAREICWFSWLPTKSCMLWLKVGFDLEVFWKTLDPGSVVGCLSCMSTFLRTILSLHIVATNGTM